MNALDNDQHHQIRKGIQWDAILEVNGKKYKPLNESPITGQPYCMWSIDGYWMTFTDYSWISVWPEFNLQLVEHEQD